MNMMNKHQNITRDSAGFTLVEMMMSLLIFGIVMAVIGNVFFTSQRLYDTTTDRAGQQMSARASLTLMVEEIRHAGANPFRYINGAPPVIAVTAADAALVTVNAELNDVQGLQTAEPSEIVTYRYDPDIDTVFRNPGTGDQELLTGVTAFTLRYFDSNNVELGPVPLPAALRSRVASVQIDITTETNRGGPMNFTTLVGIRNNYGT